MGTMVHRPPDAIKYYVKTDFLYNNKQNPSGYRINQLTLVVLYQGGIFTSRLIHIIFTYNTKTKTYDNDVVL